MVEPIEIAEFAHKLCTDKLIPLGMSPQHDITGHSQTTAYYAKIINAANLDVTGEQVGLAIIEAANWDTESRWPGHPHSDKVLAILKKE